MKYLLLSFLFAFLGCAKKDIAVTIEKYDLKVNAPSFLSLPSGSCNSEESILYCKIKPDTQIKWGTGFCENTSEELHARVEKSKIILVVNEYQIHESKILSHEEVYNRESFQYCHEWHVLLSNWHQDSTLVAMDEGKYTDVIKVVLEK